MKQVVFPLYSDVGEDDKKSPTLVKYKPLSISLQKNHMVAFDSECR